MNCHCCDAKYEQFKELDSVFQCVHCNHIYRKYSGDLAEYHRIEYRKEFKTYPFRERLKYSTNLLRFFDSLLTIDDDLLEVGSGDGYMANMVSSYVGEVTALEINPELAETAKKIYPSVTSVCANFLEYTNDDGFDLVYAIDVLEHVESVIEFVSKAIELSNKYILIQVPTNREIYSPNPKFDGHCHYFTKESLQNLFIEHKMLKFRITARGETSRGQAILALFEVK